MYEEHSPGKILQGSQWTSVDIWAAVRTDGVSVGGQLPECPCPEVASDC